MKKKRSVDVFHFQCPMPNDTSELPARENGQNSSWKMPEKNISGVVTIDA
jgi:hypothetical protein